MTAIDDVVMATESAALDFAHVGPSTCDGRAVAISIGPDEVHVWAWLIDESAVVCNAWRRILSRGEKERADRFVHHADRNRWTVAHGVLRCLLSRYCGVLPREIVFDLGASGKPSIALPGNSSRIVTFNLAHSQGRALLAVAENRPIGIDLERERPDFDPMPLARQYFSERELEAIASVPAERQRDAFFRHWVAKESVLKAQGVGLSFPLDRFFVTFEVGNTVARVQSQDPDALSPQWLVRALATETGWHAALAARGESWHVRMMA